MVGSSSQRTMVAPATTIVPIVNAPAPEDESIRKNEGDSKTSHLISQHNHSKGIEGWRYLMAVWIYVFHYGSGWTSETSNVYTAHVQTAVAAFMIISGFVLGMAYESRDWTTTNGGSTWKQWLWFMSTRTARIYPLYFISWCATLYWTITVTHWGQTWWGESVCGYDENEPGSVTARVLTSLFLLQSWAPQTFFAVNGPAWFLSTLFWVWTIFPFTIKWLKGKSVRYLIVAAIIWYIISCIPSIVLWSMGTLESDCMTGVYRDNPIFRAPEFIVGVCFGLLSNRRMEAGIVDAPAHYPKRFVKWGGDVCCLAIILPIFLFPETVDLRDNMFLPRLFVMPICIILYYTTWQQGLAAAIVSAPGLCDLGRYAWGVYILQEPLWYGLCSMVTGNGELQCFAHDDKENGWAREANNLIAVFLLLNIVSGLCLQWEVPLYKLAKKKIETYLGISGATSAGKTLQQPLEEGDDEDDDPEDTATYNNTVLQLEQSDVTIANRV